MKPILLSGIQPTGPLHIGNYLGALKNFVELQNSGKYECYFFVADYHSLTENFDPQEKPVQITDLIKEYLAAGLKPEKSVVFVQSHIPESTELAWILSTLTPFGELSRMTQFKDKSSKEAVPNVGLFTYPILMAADILLHDADFVPVGEDQLQHLEFARTLARKFNSKYGLTFKEPKALLTKFPRVMSLTNPLKKMSKSEPGGCIFLADSPAEIEEKIKKAVTDSGDKIEFNPESKPAISNLIQIFSAFADKPEKDVVKMFAGASYAKFKSALSDIVANALKDFRNAEKKLDNDDAAKIVQAGRQKLKSKAEAKIREIKTKIGLA